MDIWANRMTLILMKWARILVSATAIVGLSAHAATECEQNYTSKPSSDGGTIHQSFVGLYGMDGAKAMDGLKLSAQKIHFQPIGDSKVSPDGLITTVVAQKASATAHGFPIVMVVSPQTDSAVVAFQLIKGATTPGARANICSFFDAAGLTGKATNASHLKSAQNSTLALPLLAALNGSAAAEPAVRNSNAIGQKTVEADDNNRGAAPKVADRRKVVAPKSAFNPADINPGMLSEGNSTIRGFTCGSVPVVGGARFQTTPNQPIALFPYSKYLKEAIDLIDANRKKADRVRVDIDKRAFETRLDGKTNSNGDFQFTRIKPGRYIIMAIFAGSATSYENTPQSSYDASTNTVYEWTNHTQVNSSSNDVLQADVTVNQDGQVVEGVVVKPTGNGRFIPVLSGVCKWHHS